MPHSSWKFALVLSICLATSYAFADKASETRFETIQQENNLRIDALKESQQKDQQLVQQQLDAQKEKIEAFSSRISDLNFYLAIYAVLGTLLGIGVAFLAYIGATAKARQEAEKWFGENADKLQKRIAELSQELEQHAEKAHQQINQATDTVEQKSAQAVNTIQAQMSSSQPLQLTEESASALKAENEQRKQKPEAEYGFDDWNTRAFAAYYENNPSRAADFWGQAAQASDASSLQTARVLFNQGVALGQQGKTDEEITCYDQVITRFGDAKESALLEEVAKALLNKGVALRQQGKTDEAIACYDQIITRFGDAKESALLEQVANALLNKGVALRQQGKTDEEITCYDQIITRFGDAKESALLEQVAKARNGKGFNLLINAKQQWVQAQERLSPLTAALTLFREALTTAAPDDKPMIQGNIAYALWLLGSKQEAEAPLREALLTGKQTLYDGELADTELHTVAEDAGFRTLVEKLWAEING